MVNIRQIYNIPEPSIMAARPASETIKVHLKNGQLAILDSWFIDNERQLLGGTGRSYSFNRKWVSDLKQLQYSYSDCVLIETNDLEGFNAISPTLMVLATIWSVVTVPCLFNPKSCFGSCPTYYLKQGDSLVIQAEGFSSSITKSMEAVDVDYLPAYIPSGSNQIQIELKNEALETHYIKKSEILAVQKKHGQEVYHGNDKFYVTSQLASPIRANHDDDQLLQLLKFRDRKEYLSSSDSTDLLSKESVVLDFHQFDGSTTGVVLTQRQSFMTTFLFYQSMGYMGSKLGELMAAYERASPLVRNAQKTMYDILGGVEVSVMSDGKWKSIGTIDEQGPITSDTHILPIGQIGNFNKVKLTMTKGLWRLDQVGICTILDEKEAVVVKPSKLLNGDIQDDQALNTLLDSEEWLVNNPGTSYTLEFELPDDDNLSLFLRSQGYYTEWMRSEWLKEENPEMVRLIIKNQRKWLNLMAPKYKLIESKMEALFWSSKFGNFE